MFNPIQLLLIPLTIWSGLEQGFFSADFTQVQGSPKALMPLELRTSGFLCYLPICSCSMCFQFQAFVSCSWGIENLSLVLICFGISDAIGSVGFGPIIQYTGRVPIFLTGACLNTGTIFLLMNWKPTPDNPVVFFIIAGIWGIADAIWQTQINGKSKSC